MSQETLPTSIDIVGDFFDIIGVIAHLSEQTVRLLISSPHTHCFKQ